MEDIIIYPKKGRMIVLGLFCLPFILVGLLFVLLPIVEDASLMIAIFGAFILLFLGFCLVFYIKAIFKPKPGLKITNEGIVDQSSYLGFGLLKWEEIESVKMVKFSGQSFLGVYTYDKELIINRSGGLKRLLNNMNRGLIDTQANITVKNLAYPTNDLLDEIDLRMNKYM